MSRRVFLAIFGLLPMLVGLIRTPPANRRPLVDYAYSAGEHYHDPGNEACRFCGEGWN